MTPDPFTVHFGGPDLPVGALRDLLAERLAAVPEGGRVDWVTYYFRDRELAQELVDAAERGVRVTLVLEGKPRVARANEAVISLLRSSGALDESVDEGGEKHMGENVAEDVDQDAKSGLRIIEMPGIPAPGGLAWKPQVHEKIYCFSHPEPTAFVGSFNPSGDCPEEDPAVVAEIGDHRVAHNALVEIRDAALADCLAGHVRTLHRDGPWRRGDTNVQRDFDVGDTQVHFWPRRGGHPIEQLLDRYGAGSRVRIAASHIRNPGSVACLKRLAGRGAHVEVTAEHTARRVPPRVERRLRKAGVEFARLGADIDVPMHLKFVLAENQVGDRVRRQVAFGSFNWTLPSYWLNHEVAVVTREVKVFEAFDRRWRELQSAVAAH